MGKRNGGRRKTASWTLRGLCAVAALGIGCESFGGSEGNAATDGGIVSESGSSAKRTLVCGESPCAAPDACCIYGGGESCGTWEGCPSTSFRLRCRDQSQCPAAQHCCLRSNGVGGEALCKPECASDESVMCDDSFEPPSCERGTCTPWSPSGPTSRIYVCR